MEPIYRGTNSQYLQLNQSWHAEDSPWKAKQIVKSFLRNNINPSSIVEVGCGVGEILIELEKSLASKKVNFKGYDIAEDAIEKASNKNSKSIQFHHGDFLKTKSHFDVLLMIDVFEHVEDYLGLIKKCKERADYKIFHIPLDLSVSSIIRNRTIVARKNLGHLHYFHKETAIASIKDSGYTIIDSFYTKVAEEQNNLKLKTKFANLFRKLFYNLNKDLCVKLFGGYSLLVVAK